MAKNAEPVQDWFNENRKPKIYDLRARKFSQLIDDFASKPVDELKIFDLATGHGLYSIECGLKGAEVIGIDVRDDRMSIGRKLAEEHGLSKVKFKTEDVRNITIDSYGQADIVLFLGILYHLNSNDAISVLRNIFEMTKDLVIIDTHISLNNSVEILIENEKYYGRYYKEHSETDSPEDKRKNLLASIDNNESFWFTKKSLLKLLQRIGFTSVCECQVPLDPGKPNDRITVIAKKGRPVKVGVYPHLNHMEEKEFEDLFEPKAKDKSNLKSLQTATSSPLKKSLSKIFGALGYSIKKL